MTTSPAIARLETWLAKAGLRFAIAPSDFAVLHRSAIDILVHSEALPPLRVTVFDEYGDLGTADPLLALVLVGRGFGELVDGMDISGWAKAEGLDPGDPGAALLYQQLSAARASFIAAWGEVPDEVTDLDWQLNAGIARALRRNAGLLPKR